MTNFGWLLDLLPVATPAPECVAAGVANSADAGSPEKRSVDEVPHLPHLPHSKDSEAANDADLWSDLGEHLAERAAILEHDAGLDRAKADTAAVRIVQCSTCTYWTPDPLGGGGIGTCATGADSESWSAFDGKPLNPWPDAPRFCSTWCGNG